MNTIPWSSKGEDVKDVIQPSLIPSLRTIQQTHYMIVTRVAESNLTLCPHGSIFVSSRIRQDQQR